MSENTQSNPPIDEKHLLDDIKNSIMGMQQQMQSTYSNLAELEITGESHDKTVKIVMSATYELKDILFGPPALEGGVKNFKRRIFEAWKDLSEKIQKTTQSKTIELLQGMQIPDEIRNISMEDLQDDEGGEGGEGGTGSAGDARLITDRSSS